MKTREELQERLETAADDIELAIREMVGASYRKDVVLKMLRAAQEGIDRDGDPLDVNRRQARRALRVMQLGLVTAFMKASGCEEGEVVLCQEITERDGRAQVEWFCKRKGDGDAEEEA